ncbi:hypothetical protein [Corynebacterium matruchotii]|uniref:phage tail tube protein n=1 Tax=Corynebacterium matruchotii TaxID=43768 RepID=UPI00243102D1|nr:hypothetical protein [Corynebacterium matruchotii]
MSDFADSKKAHVWLDGDAFRAPVGTAMPTDPFAATLTGWDAYGGIEAGIEVTAEQQVTKKKIWNKRNAIYKIIRDALESGMKYRAVDNSKAALLTRLQGGKITKKGDLYVAELGLGEEFAFFCRFDDGVSKMAFYCPRVTLASPAKRATLDDQNLDGWEFENSFLEGYEEILPELPAGITVP